jgi:hypothetical protein
MEDIERRLGSRFEAKAIIAAGEVQCVAPGARIVQISYWNCEEILFCDHLFAYTQAEFLYLFSNVVEKSVTGPPP